LFCNTTQFNGEDKDQEAYEHWAEMMDITQNTTAEEMECTEEERDAFIEYIESTMSAFRPDAERTFITLESVMNKIKETR
jgi:ketosteroid isomerase-like protein